MKCHDCLERRTEEWAVGYECEICWERYISIGNLKPKICMKCSEENNLCMICKSDGGE